MRGYFVLFLGLLWANSLAAQSGQPELNVRGWHASEWFQLEIENPTNRLYSIESSSDLGAWSTVGVLHGREYLTNLPALPFVDARAASVAPRYYRVRAEELQFEHDWRNQVYYWDDPFRGESLSFGVPETRWIKFAILTNEPGRVYYQNSFKYKFHYDFAKARLPGFAGLSPTQFDEISLHTNSQRVILGAVLFAPHPKELEAGVQFVGQDPYAIEDIARWFEVVRATILPLDGVKLKYIPTFEQIAVAQSQREYLAGRGIELGSLVEWDTGLNAYATGWAIGTVKFVPGHQIEEAYANGSLKPEDILLTDSIPAELPYLAGIMSLAPSTPNSHVAILARSYGVPFVYLAEPELRELAQASVGREIVLTAFPGYPQVSIQLLDMGNVAPAVREEIAALKGTPPLAIIPKAKFGAYTASTDNLSPSDIKFFGGKAANFGFLRRQIPSDSPAAIAISFDLWDDFMSQAMPSGKTLREEIASRLGRYSYPTDVGALAADLQVIRDWIEDDTQFTAAQQDQIAAALLGRFDPQRKIRFRSSTNVEDSENFTGAGLYDSYSGCLADDQDSDTAGPSICDAVEGKERGVFRAIRKVYASFYNDNAFLERLRHGVQESEVGMAILVHYSSPDETEMANGVATIAFEKGTSGLTFSGKMVTQKGAASVTNPDDSAVPEVATVSYFFESAYANVQQWSSLMPFGASVLAWDSEYKAFAGLFHETAKAFGSYYPAKQRFTLDFEYKKIIPGKLLVKQVREIPSADPAATTPTFLINQPLEWCVEQGEFGTVFGNHRLKAKLQLSTRDLKLTTNNLGETIFGPISITYVEDGEIKTIAGVPSAFEGASHRIGEADFYGTPVIDSWQMGAEEAARTVNLSTRLRTGATAEQSPIITLEDGRLEWSAVYEEPMPVVEFGPKISSVTQESVVLRPAWTTNDRSIEITRRIPRERGAAITTTFYWPAPPQGPTAGYTAPLVDWKETKIEGLTTEPIILRDYYTQTYRPGHHNFSEEFLFEPALEPGISPAQIAELEGQGIRYIYALWAGDDGIFQSYIYVAGEDWKWRPLVTKEQSR